MILYSEISQANQKGFWYVYFCLTWPEVDSNVRILESTEYYIVVSMQDSEQNGRCEGPGKTAEFGAAGPPWWQVQD